MASLNSAGVIRAARKPEPTSLSIAAAGHVEIEAKSGDGEPKRPSFKILGYTGAPMNVAGFYSPVIVDLAGLKAPSQEIPVFMNHDADRIVGQTSGITIDASGVMLNGTVTGDNAHAEEVVSQAKNGFKWRASIGANVDRREFLDGGKKATINGREVTGPMVIAREATLHEVSFVPIGADNATSAAVAASKSSASTPRESTMFETWLKAKGFEDPAALSDEQRTSLKAMYDAEQARNAPPPNPQAPPTPQAPPAQPLTLDQIIAEQRAEQTRIDRITELTAEAIHERPMMLDEFERMAKAAIAAKSTVAEFELALLRASRSRVAPTVHTHGQSPTGPKVLEAAVCRVARLNDLEKVYDARTLEAADQRFPNGISLTGLLLLAARENGHTFHDARDVRGLLRAAFTPAPHAIRAEGFSTLSLPNVFANIANKFLVMGFQAVESAWRQVTAIRNVSDFKTITSIALTGDMTYEKVGAAGELKHATLGEQIYTNKAETYGKLFAITRTDIINDDLGALTEVPRKLGRGAALAINKDFWTKFLAGVGSFWAAGNNNLITGGTTALTATSLATAYTTFKKQTDYDGMPIAVEPKILLVPPELATTALALVNSTLVVANGGGTNTLTPNANVWVDKFQVVVSTYLSNTAFTGNSTTAWFLLADPQDIPTMEVAFLNGRETPIVESAEAEFDTLGVQMRGYHDWGSALQEPRGSLRSAGA